MKKNYTLKITLAMLFVVLVSLVSFVGVYKGKNLVKDYSFGKDFSNRKIAVFSVKEETTTQNDTGNSATSDENTTNENTTSENTASENTTSENTTSENTTSENTADENSNTENQENDKKKNYENAKNIIERRLASLSSNEYDIRLNEDDGTLVIEVPTSMETSYITELVSKGNVQIKNKNTTEVIVDSNGFYGASAKLNTTSSSYSNPVVELNIKFKKDAKNAIKNANTKYTDSEGKEQDATFELVLDDETLYSDTASSFVETAKNGYLDLSLGQSDKTSEIEANYESAQILVSVINNGEIPVKYEAKSVNIVSSNINVKTIIIIAIIISAIAFIYAIMKFKAKAVLPMLSLIGLVASILLIVRYTNVKLTLFTVLGVAIITIANYALIFKTLKGEKTFKENSIEMLNILIPCIIIAIVFCCAPYIQLATLGMTIFWSIIVMYVYNIIITRTLIDK